MDYDQQQLENAIRPDTSLVSVMTVNNEIGVTQPVKEIGKLLCHLMNGGSSWLKFIQILHSYMYVLIFITDSTAVSIVYCSMLVLLVVVD